MYPNRIVRSMTLAALSAGLWIQAAHADPLACQARAVGTSGFVPLGVWFEALTAGGNPPLAYHWNFGDGTTSSQRDPFHVYAEVGIYGAVLTVTPTGMPTAACRDTAVVFVAMHVDPLCWASANPRWSESADPIRFESGPGLLFDPGPYVWTWRFGDGSTRTLQSDAFILPVEHAYAVPGTYWAAVTLQTSRATYDCYSPSLRVTTLVPQGPVGVERPDRGGRLRLEPPRPSPFRFATTLGYALPRAGRARLVILDPQGRRVATLADGERAAGRHVAVWQGRTDEGGLSPPGVYVAALEQAGVVRTVRIVRLR